MFHLLDIITNEQQYKKLESKQPQGSHIALLQINTLHCQQNKQTTVVGTSQDKVTVNYKAI